MRSRRIIAVGFLAVLVSGCQSQLRFNGQIESSSDPYYRFDQEAPVLVMAVQGGSNIFQSRSYVSPVAEALRAKGFPEVVEEQYANERPLPPKLIAVVSAEKVSKTYQYTEAVYGTKQIGSTTHCSTGGNTANCTTTPTNLYGVKVGEETKTGYFLDHTLRLTWYDVSTQAMVFSTVTSSAGSGCADEVIFVFLVEQAIQRMKFGESIDEKFTVTMPDGSRCR